MRDGGPLEEDDGLAVDNSAVGDHREGFIERNLEDLDVFSLFLESASRSSSPPPGPVWSADEYGAA